MKKKLKNVQMATTRPQLERMHAILRRIQKGDYPSRSVLAGELECTTRTIQRDITFMQNRERLPIAFDFFKHGYYLTEKLADFPLLQISEGEIVALFVAQRAMAQYRGTPFEQPLRLPKDEVELKITLTSTVEIARWILSWGSYAKVIDPPELVGEIQQTLRRTLAAYTVE